MKLLNLIMVPLALAQTQIHSSVTMSKQTWRVDVDGNIEHEKRSMKNPSFFDDMRRENLGIERENSDTRENKKKIDENDMVIAVQDVKEIKAISASNLDLLTVSGNNGYRELHTAAYKGNVDIVKALLDKGADVDTQDEDGVTVLHVATHQGHADIVKALLDNGAYIDAKEKKIGYTALHLAAHQGHADIVKALLDNGAYIAAKGRVGFTALHIAAVVKGNKEIVKLLLKAGADVNAKDHHGKTALHWAANNGHEEIVKLLRDRGNKFSYNLIALSMGAVGIRMCYTLYQKIKRDKQSKTELQEKKTKLRDGLKENNPNELTTINCKLKNDDSVTKYYVVNAGLEIPISQQEYNSLSKKNEIEEDKNELVEKYKKLLIDIEQCETIEDALKLERMKANFERCYMSLKQKTENKNNEIKNVIGLEQYLEKYWHAINRNHMTVLSETKKPEIHKELYNNTNKICKLLKLEGAAIKKIIYQIKIRSEVDKVAEEISKNMKQLSEERMDQSEKLGELYEVMKLQTEEIRTENNQEANTEFIKTLEGLKAQYDTIYKEQIDYLATVNLSYTFIFQQFQGREIKGFLEKCSNDKADTITLEINSFIKYLENLGIDSQGNGTIIGSTLSSMLLSRISIPNTTNSNELAAGLDDLAKGIKTWFKNSMDYDSEQHAIKQQATKHIGLLRKLNTWEPPKEKKFTDKVWELRDLEGLQKKQCILNNTPHTEKQKQHHLNDTEKVQDDFKKGLERLNEEFCEYRLKRIELNDNQLASLADFFINNANKKSNNGSHYRLEYPGVIIPSEHTPLKPADIIDNWIRLNIISSVLLVKPDDQHDK